MNIKKYASFLLILFAMLFIADDANAQRRGTKKRKSRESEEVKDKRLGRTQSSIREKLTFDIGFGNPFFIGGTGSTQFNFALKPGVALKIHEKIAGGVFIKGDYLYFVDRFDQTFHLLDYGAGVYGKVRIFDPFYLRIEGAYQNYAFDRTQPNQAFVLIRDSFIEPLAGIGYVGSSNSWNFGMELMFHLNGDVINYAGSVLEYWLKLDYKF